MIAFDTETTGVDHRHGARPFFVTTCDEDGAQTFWEWDVDPLTRRPTIPAKDVEEVRGVFRRSAGWGKFAEDVRERHVLVAQNGKFDVTALHHVGVFEPSADRSTGGFPWHMLRDTLVAGHLLASNHRHDLTSMLLEVGVRIQPFEDALEAACIEARKIARKHHPEWRIAREGLHEAPSIKGGSSDKGGRGKEKDKLWKNDAWLPRAVAKADGLPPSHPWWTVLQEYANADSAGTLALWQHQREQLIARNLWAIFLEQMRLPQVIFDMEAHGITSSGAVMDETESRFREESELLGARMYLMANERGHELDLPKNGVNNNLRTFCFDVLDLPRVYSSKAKTSAPALDAKNAIPHWLAVLEQGSDERNFVEWLLEKRGFDTGLTFMAAYRKFWLPHGKHPNWYRLHPTTNQTGTDTLRMSCSNPNGQQISKKERFNLRGLFGPAPGREWWSLDAKNIELRIPAYESQEPDLIELFERSSEPPFYGSQHLLNFSVVYPDLWEQAVATAGEEGAAGWIKSSEGWESTWYQWVKNGDFAIQYNCGPATADRSFHREGSYRRLKSRFAKLERLNQRCIDFARKTGYVETMPDSSVDPHRGYPLLVSRSEWGEVLPTTPLNYHVSGTACWWKMRAMVRVWEQLQQWNVDLPDGEGYYLVLEVHDELLFDFPKGNGPEPWRANLPKIRKVQALMEVGGEHIGVPTPVTVEYHEHNWGKSVVL